MQSRGWPDFAGRVNYRDEHASTFVRTGGRMEQALSKVLAAGSLVFLASALCLLVAPGAFADWIGLESGPAVAWTLRMTGVCLLGLAGLMWLVRRADDAGIRGAAAVMIIASAGMTILTAALQGAWTPIRWAYFGVGAGFCAAYLVLLLTAVMQDRRRR